MSRKGKKAKASKKGKKGKTRIVIPGPQEAGPDRGDRRPAASRPQGPPAVHEARPGRGMKARRRAVASRHIAAPLTDKNASSLVQQHDPGRFELFCNIGL